MKTNKIDLALKSARFFYSHANNIFDIYKTTSTNDTMTKAQLLKQHEICCRRFEQEKRKFESLIESEISL